MPEARVHLVVPDLIADFTRVGPLRQGLNESARLVGAELTIEEPGDSHAVSPPDSPRTRELPLQYRGKPLGRIAYCPDDNGAPVARIASAMAFLLEHALDREMAVGDLAHAMTTSYEELNLLHSLLSEVAIRTEAADIGQLLVDETARTLNCRRVSLLVLDETRENLRMLASRGVPPETRDVIVPASDSVAGRVLFEGGLLVVDDVTARPDLAALSCGRYETDSFAVIRVPLSARGEPVGVLAATERMGDPEFTTRDCKMFEGLSSIAASALLNCRLHAAVSHQMISTIQALASAVDAKDHYTHDHSGRVAQLCVATARRMGISDRATCREVELAGLLHDIGKIGIPDSILSKTEALTTAEYATIRTHVQIGARIVEHVPGLERVAKAILHHHERYDGLGYPSGLAGDAIPLTSKLISAADVFDTMTSDRPYRRAVSKEETIQELQRCTGTQQDPAVVDALVAVLRQETEGSAAKSKPNSSKN